MKRIIATLFIAATFVFGQTPAAAPVPITDADLKSVAAPSAEAKVKGDPGGTLTGTVIRRCGGDSKKGLTVADW